VSCGSSSATTCGAGVSGHNLLISRKALQQRQLRRCCCPPPPAPLPAAAAAALAVLWLRFCFWLILFGYTPGSHTYVLYSGSILLY
jgi:hypothetical protein